VCCAHVLWSHLRVHAVQKGMKRTNYRSMPVARASFPEIRGFIRGMDLPFI